MGSWNSEVRASEFQGCSGDLLLSVKLDTSLCILKWLRAKQNSHRWWQGCISSWSSGHVTSPIPLQLNLLLRPCLLTCHDIHIKKNTHCSLNNELGISSAWNGAWDILESSEAGLRNGSALRWELAGVHQKPAHSGIISEFPKLRQASHLPTPYILPCDAQLDTHMTSQLSWLFTCIPLSHRGLCEGRWSLLIHCLVPNISP